MDFGFVGNGTTMYELTALARHVQAAYDELRAAGSKPGKARRPRRSAAHAQ